MHQQLLANKVGPVRRVIIPKLGHIDPKVFDLFAELVNIGSGQRRGSVQLEMSDQPPPYRPFFPEGPPSTFSPAFCSPPTTFTGSTYQVPRMHCSSFLSDRRHVTTGNPEAL
ncbi:hypothetical protein AMECASPLE_030778 [Ameca splendens]|uniref:Uncharacterized protein n=1 Tax=Ameca splendens TaxID=208324 RepID=A0ABV0XVA3_9TELE